MSALAKAAELAKSTASVPHTSWPPVNMLLPLLVQPHTCCCSRRKAARFSPAPHSGGGVPFHKQPCLMPVSSTTQAGCIPRPHPAISCSQGAQQQRNSTCSCCRRPEAARASTSSTKRWGSFSGLSRTQQVSRERACPPSNSASRVLLCRTAGAGPAGPCLHASTLRRPLYQASAGILRRPLYQASAGALGRPDEQHLKGVQVSSDKHHPRGVQAE